MRRRVLIKFRATSAGFIGPLFLISAIFYTDERGEINVSHFSPHRVAIKISYLEDFQRQRPIYIKLYIRILGSLSRGAISHKRGLIPPGNRSQ